MTSINAYRSFPYTSTQSGQAVAQSPNAAPSSSADPTQATNTSSITDPTDTQPTKTTESSSDTAASQRVQANSGSHSVIAPAEPHAAYPTANTHKLQNNELALQQQLTNYKAVSFSNHGYKGNFIDATT
jgi:uncharacterized membrane protein